MTPIEEDDDEVSSRSQGDLQRVADGFASSVNGWAAPSDPVDLGNGLQWRPHLVGPNGEVAYVHLLQEVSPQWERRMRAAHARGRQVFVIAPPEAWISSATLSLAAELAAIPVMASEDRDGTLEFTQRRSVPELIARESILVDAKSVGQIGHMLLSRARDAESNFEKGRLFEDVLLLIFSQLDFLKFVATRKVTDTEEMDLVFQMRKEMAQLPRSPVVIVSAKNEKGRPTDKNAYLALYSSMREKRGQCSLAFLCAAHRITGTVMKQAAKGASEPYVIVALDGAFIDRLLREPSRMRDLILEAVNEAILS